MARVLVTGASGFIGGHLVAALVRRGDRVRCLVRRSSKVEHLGGLDVEIITGDIEDAAALNSAVAGNDTVYHLAGLTSAFRPEQLHAVNGDGTGHVVAACAKQTTPPVHVLVSSVAAVGPIARGAVRNETDPPRPVSHYGRSKLAGETAAAARAADVPTTIVRPGIVFGPRNTECLPIFRTIARVGLHPIVGFRRQRVSVIYVHDLVEILLRAADRGIRLPSPSAENGSQGSGCYFACRDEFPTYGELGRRIARALGRSFVLVIPAPIPLAWTVAGVNELLMRWRGKPDSLNIDKIREARAPSWACSPASVNRDLRFTPHESLDEQLRATVAWYREHGWLRPTSPRLSTIAAVSRDESVGTSSRS